MMVGLSRRPSVDAHAKAPGPTTSTRPSPVVLTEKAPPYPPPPPPPPIDAATLCGSGAVAGAGVAGATAELPPSSARHRADIGSRIAARRIAFVHRMMVPLISVPG